MDLVDRGSLWTNGVGGFLSGIKLGICRIKGRGGDKAGWMMGLVAEREGEASRVCLVGL